SATLAALMSRQSARLLKASTQLIAFAFWTIAGTSIMMAPVSAAPAQNLVWQQADVNTKFLGKETNLLSLNFDVYHSGRLHDLLILSSTNSILVGAEKGGVWLVSPNGSALAVSNSWARPDINAMTFGFGNQKHVFAGGSGLYVTDYNSLFPYLS